MKPVRPVEIREPSGPWDGEASRRGLRGRRECSASGRQSFRRSASPLLLRAPAHEARDGEKGDAEEHRSDARAAVVVAGGAVVIRLAARVGLLLFLFLDDVA